MRLSDKVALITGGGTGIGRATALLFAQEGASVFITGRKSEPLEKTAENIRGSYVVGDVSKPEDVGRVIDRVIDDHGRIDVLVNNAGIYSGSEEDVMRTNYEGVKMFSEGVIPHMNAGGSIVNVSSICGLAERFLDSAYGKSKAKVIELTKRMALKHARDKIRINCVAPSATYGDMLNEASGGNPELFLPEHPLGRLGQPSDVAYGILYLASDESSWVTGIVLPIEGGFFLQEK